MIVTDRDVGQSKAQLTVDIFAKIAEGNIDIINATKLLNKSRRTVECYLQRYRQVGIQFVVHQNSGKPGKNRICDRTKRLVQSLIKKKYFVLNLTHLPEMFNDNGGILIKRKGLFKTLYEDRAGVFGEPKRCDFSQVKRAFEELGIQILFANSAQGKGKGINLDTIFIVKEYRKIRNIQLWQQILSHRITSAPFDCQTKNRNPDQQSPRTGR